MQPTTPPHRFPDELERAELATEVENCLGPLAEYCDTLEAEPNLSNEGRLALFQITEFITAVGRYDEATDRLLGSYRLALEHAERPSTAPTLEEALLGQMSLAQLLSHRAADPVYRLGFNRGKRQGVAETEAKYERISALYAQYAIIVPPLTYKPSPLLARLKTYLGRLLMAGPRLPLTTRQLLFNQTPSTISTTAS